MNTNRNLIVTIIILAIIIVVLLFARTPVASRYSYYNPAGLLSASVTPLTTTAPQYYPANIHFGGTDTTTYTKPTVYVNPTTGISTYYRYYTTTTYPQYYTYPQYQYYPEGCTSSYGYSTTTGLRCDGAIY